MYIEVLLEINVDTVYMSVILICLVVVSDDEWRRKKKKKRNSCMDGGCND